MWSPQWTVLAARTKGCEARRRGPANGASPLPVLRKHVMNLLLCFTMKSTLSRLPGTVVSGKLVLLRSPVNLHLGAVRNRLAVGWNARLVVGDRLGIAEDHSDHPFVPDDSH